MDEKGEAGGWRVVAAVDESSDDAEVEENKALVLPKKKPPQRRMVYCPVPECTAPPLKKVSQRLWQFHKLGDSKVHCLRRTSDMPQRTKSKRGGRRQ